MRDLVLSSGGKLGCGSYLTSCDGNHIPATITLVKEDGENTRVEPDHVAFSSFAVERTAHLGAKTKHGAGDHVALAFNGSDSFFSAVVIRCDTWAVQWAVQNDACLSDASITHLVTLCSNTVCGVATTRGDASSKKQCFFVATRFDVPQVTRAENKEWRPFLASPRCIETGLNDEEIVSISAFDENSVLLLTSKGSLSLVRLDVRALRAESAQNTPFYVVDSIQANLKGTGRDSRVVVYNDGGEYCFAAVYTKLQKVVHILQFPRAADGAPFRTGGKTAALELSTEVPIEDLCFAGPFHLSVSCARPRDNLQFVGLVPGIGAVEGLPFEPLTVPHPPLGTYYNGAAEQFVVLSTAPSSQTVKTFTALPRSEMVKSLIQTRLAFSSSPFSQHSLDGTTWSKVSNPFRHYGPQSRRQVRKEEEGDSGEDDLQVLQGVGAESSGRWTPLTLCYALATKTSTSSDRALVAVFAVETAPFLHSRLIRQWHNATAGLKSILSTVSSRGSLGLTLPWNPRHIRRALRLLSHNELSSLLHCAATTIEASARVSSPVSYPDAAAATSEIAFHAITLARQMGAALAPEDVRTVAIVFRASRECGHELLRYAGRMELLLESYLQQKAMSRVLDRRATAGDAAGTVGPSLENFFGISAELQTVHTLHTRYAANMWAQHLAKQRPRHKAEAESAARLLATVQNDREKSTEDVVSDWRELGSAPHQDPLLDRFERSFV